ncbi:MAG: cadherin-like domain-containing protein, partial [Acidobacteria bacterium]|nr:cadherin-like domain-containing protein [Acidobacteriota bacterium]
IRLRSPTGANLGSESGPLTAQISVIAPLSGTYTVLVGTGDVGNDSIGDYRLTLAKTPGTFVVPDGDEGGAMVNGANHSGHIHLGDLDQWSFTAAQGDAITVSIGEVFPTELDPGFNPWIRLRSPTGADLGSASGALTAQISVVAPLSGTYTVLVGTGDVGLDSTGDYRLTLAKTPGPFVVPDGDQGGAMSAGVNHPGAIHLGDLDMWTFCAAQGAALSISMSEILPSGPDPGFNPWIRLRAPSGQQLGSTSGSLVAQLNITASVTGLFTVLAGTGDVGSDAQGQYEIRVTGAIACPTGPTTVNDGYATPVNTLLTVPAPGLLANDNPNGGGSMTAELVSNVTAGTLALNANGSFTFTPTNGFTGQASFTYRAVNAFGPGNVATVTLTVTQGTPPTTVNDAYGTNAGTPLNIAAPGVLSNDNSNGGGALTAELMSTTTSGVLSLSANGSFTYTPNPGFIGADSFTYRAVSSVGPGNTATVGITVSDPTTVQPPSSLYASSIAGNTVTLRWTPPASGAVPTNYVIEGGVSPGQVLASLPVGNTTPLYTFPAPTGAFFVRVHTLSGASRSVASNEIRIFVNQPAAPSAPADLVGLVNSSSIALAWRNTFAGGAPGGIVLDVSGALNTSLPLGLTDSFQFNGVPGGTYTLSLRAINGAGSSPSSNAITLTFPSPCTGAPLPPSNFLAYRVGGTLFVVWDPATSGPAPTSYVLNVTGAFGGSFGTPGRTLSGAVGPGTYHLSVSAANACGSSAATPVQAVVVP